MGTFSVSGDLVHLEELVGGRGHGVRAQYWTQPRVEGVAVAWIKVVDDKSADEQLADVYARMLDPA